MSLCGYNMQSVKVNHYENSRRAIQTTGHKSPSLDFKDIHL